jgi:hypothetical protein
LMASLLLKGDRPSKPARPNDPTRPRPMYEPTYAGITCRDVRAQLEAYRDRTLSEPVQTKIRNHLEQCFACQEALNDLLKASASYRPRTDYLYSSVPPGFAHPGAKRLAQGR